MIPYHNINPDIVKFSLFGLPLQIRWYGLFYVISFILAYFLFRKNLRYRQIEMDREKYESAIFYVMLGVILGGRIGYILFYNLLYYFQNPMGIFAVWEGGMSFHGGALGVIFAGVLFARKYRYRFMSLADAAVPLVAIGLGLGRLGNFINGELFGKPTALPWGMVFPDSDGLPRHPTQVYEMLLEGAVLWVVAMQLLKRIKREGIVFWSFIGLYGVFRFLVEFVRQPDDIEFYTKFGMIFGFMSIGQFLSLLMILAALIGLYVIYKRKEDVTQA